MKPSSQMKKFIETVMSKRLGLPADVSALPIGSQIEISRGPSYMRLVIERPAKYQVTVTHYREKDDPMDDAQADPDVDFLLGCDNELYPTSMTDTFGLSLYATYNVSTGRLDRCNLRGQRDLATFTNQWARNLRQQKFHTLGEISPN